MTAWKSMRICGRENTEHAWPQPLQCQLTRERSRYRTKFMATITGIQSQYCRKSMEISEWMSVVDGVGVGTERDDYGGRRGATPLYK